MAVIRCGVFFLRFFACGLQKCVSKPLQCDIRGIES
nr:MAG TPA: hypothetical protein [Caudoviricetes sp.]